MTQPAQQTEDGLNARVLELKIQVEKGIYTGIAMDIAWRKPKKNHSRLKLELQESRLRYESLLTIQKRQRERATTP